MDRSDVVAGTELARSRGIPSPARLATPGVGASSARATRLGRSMLHALLLAGALLVVDLTAMLQGARLVGLEAPLAGATAMAQTDACAAGWRELPIPDEAFLSTPFEIITHEGQPSWILGGANAGVLALRWDGSSWGRGGLSAPGHRGLVGGDSRDGRTVIAVGYNRPIRGEGEGSLLPISGELRGSTWKGRSVPVPPGPRATLTDVVSLPKGAAWAVGTRLEDGRLRAYAVRWTGTRWTRHDPSVRGGSGLQAIDEAPDGAIWAVGWRESRPGQPGPYIARLDRGRWRTVTAPKLPKGVVVLTDVAFRSKRQGWATGYLAAKGSDQATAILLGWDGSRWTREPLLWAGDGAALPRSISISQSGDIWMAGAQPATDAREARGFIARRRAVDGTWQVDVLGVPADVRSEVMAVAATQDGAVAAANVGASLLVLETCPEALAPAAKAKGRARIKVSHMKQRRRARAAEDHVVTFDGESYDAGAARFGPAGRGPRGPRALPAPVPPSGFTVVDVAANVGLAEWTKTYAGLAADFDGNGFRDVFYSRHGGQRPRLAMNGPGGFSEGAAEAFSPVDRHGCDSDDVDADGNPDILCAVGAARGKAVQRHELSLAPDKGDRQLVRGGRGISDPLGRGRTVGFIRLDGDAFPEVFIGNAPDRDDGLPSYSRFYRNVGGAYVPAPGIGLDSTHGAGCIEVSDADLDGDEDLAYCAAYSFKGRPPGLRLMRNEGGRLKDRTGELGLEPIGDIAVAFADVSGDGARDLLQLSRQLLRVSRWTGQAYERVFEARLSDAMSLAAGDVSGDGTADIYIVRGNDSGNRPDLLLVASDGGRAFTSVVIPQTRKGSADGVIALDFDQNGRTDFVVLNGLRKAGPVQLLATYPQ